MQTQDGPSLLRETSKRLRQIEPARTALTAHGGIQGFLKRTLVWLVPSQICTRLCIALKILLLSFYILKSPCLVSRQTVFLYSPLLPLRIYWSSNLSGTRLVQTHPDHRTIRIDRGPRLWGRLSSFQHLIITEDRPKLA
jgi:hypothetical protein